MSLTAKSYTAPMISRLDMSTSEVPPSVTLPALDYDAAIRFHEKTEKFFSDANAKPEDFYKGEHELLASDFAQYQEFVRRQTNPNAPCAANIVYDAMGTLDAQADAATIAEQLKWVRPEFDQVVPNCEAPVSHNPIGLSADQFVAEAPAPTAGDRLVDLEARKSAPTVTAPPAPAAAAPADPAKAAEAALAKRRAEFFEKSGPLLNASLTEDLRVANNPQRQALAKLIEEHADLFQTAEGAKTNPLWIEQTIDGMLVERTLLEATEKGVDNLPPERGLAYLTELNAKLPPEVLRGQSPENFAHAGLAQAEIQHRLYGFVQNGGQKTPITPDEYNQFVALFPEGGEQPPDVIARGELRDKGILFPGSEDPKLRRQDFSKSLTAKVTYLNGIKSRVTKEEDRKSLDDNIASLTRFKSELDKIDAEGGHPDYVKIKQSCAEYCGAKMNPNDLMKVLGLQDPGQVVPSTNIAAQIDEKVKGQEANSPRTLFLQAVRDYAKAGTPEEKTKVKTDYDFAVASGVSAGSTADEIKFYTSKFPEVCEKLDKGEVTGDYLQHVLDYQSLPEAANVANVPQPVLPVQADLRSPVADITPGELSKAVPAGNFKYLRKQDRIYLMDPNGKNGWEINATTRSMRAIVKETNDKFFYAKDSALTHVTIANGPDGAKRIHMPGGVTTTQDVEGNEQHRAIPTAVLQVESVNDTLYVSTLNVDANRKVGLVDTYRFEATEQRFIPANGFQTSATPELLVLTADANLYNGQRNEQYLSSNGQQGSDFTFNRGDQLAGVNTGCDMQGVWNADFAQRMERARKSGRSEKERLLEYMVGSMMGGGGGPMMGGGYGPGFNTGVQGTFTDDYWNMNAGYGNQNVGVNVGLDSEGGFGFGLGYQGADFGFNIGFNNGYNSGGFNPSCNLYGYQFSFEDVLLMIMDILEQIERERIGKLIMDMHNTQKKMGGITQKSNVEKPAELSSLNADVSVKMQMLSMATSKRSQILEQFSHMIKTSQDAKRSIISNMRG